MSVKLNPPSPSSPRRSSDTQAPQKNEVTHPLARLGQGLQRVAQQVDKGVDRLVDTFEAKLPSLPNPAAAGKAPWEGITLTGNPLQIPLDKLLSVDLSQVRKVLERVVPQKIRDDEAKQLVGQTQNFRETLSKVRALATELELVPPSHPRHAEVKAALAKAEGELTSKYGYTRTTAPKPGAMWVDPQFMGKELPGGQMSASRLPTGTPVTKPPEPLDFLFGGKPDGAAQAKAYQQEVAARRAELGMPVQDGKPIGVHMSLQGGGGKGKRYAAMLSEMQQLGVVPVSLTGTSAGSIAAAFAATGASPKQIEDIAKDPRLQQLYDFDLDMKDGGLLNGNNAYELFDQKLRELTGIKDRPVTFADLKVPLQLVAAKAYDSAAPNGFPTNKDRIFVFSQETTPDTPVALAMRASMAIPGVFEPVQVVDPTTGRSIHLTDGGSLDNLPMGYGKHNLPQIGAALVSPDENHPSNAVGTAKPLPTGQLDTTNLLWSAVNGYTFLKDNATGAADFRDRTQPGANQFMLSLPTWNLDNPKQSNSMLGFGYDAKVDPVLDTQTRQVTRDFLKDFMDDMRVPGSRGANVTTSIPQNLRFNEQVTVNGQNYQISYNGGDNLVAHNTSTGKKSDLKLGQKKIEAMYLDHLAYGDLKAQLAHAVTNPRSVKPDWLPF
ncbi:patatin-like phospholipase family protein [Hyalangium rubrum]|uniref:Patatin-like phospholipase family protein n=1 Tax=Hyalangium rubrum TaxID=3103134 RepID=A0ABU5H993_9BACT|nr:patatin-like phospholipase family protein [Hyalangium sp. s54d21]MDY7230058.1 patatin-like phospholipase family protein [Hyalangium sp. s54d21]